MNATRDAHSLVNWFFRDRATGKVTVAQFPNAPLWVFIILTAGRLIFHPAGLLPTVTSIVGAAALITWAVLEIGWGVNPFRRMLGAVVLIAAIAMQALPLVH